MSRLPPLLTHVQWLGQVEPLPVERPRHYTRPPTEVPPHHDLTTCPRCSAHVLQVRDPYGQHVLLDPREVPIVTWATLRARDLLAPELLTRSTTGWDGTCLVSGVVVTHPDTRTPSGAPAPPPPPTRARARGATTKAASARPTHAAEHPLTYLRPQQVPYILPTTTIRPLHVLTCTERT